MPANFPNNPAINQLYSYSGATWKFTGTKWQLVTVTDGNTGTLFTYSNTAPQAPSLGDRWLNSETLRQSIYINDGDTDQWVEPISIGLAGAAKSLNNLANVSINTDLLPAANVTHDLGSSSLRWRDLYLSGNSIILGAATLTSTGSAVNLPAGTTVGGQNVATSGDVSTGGGPKITNVEVTSNSYVVLDDTAVDIAGGYIKITGTGFAAGCQVLINNTPATSTTFIGPTEVRAQLPATAAGTYMLYVINADGGVAIRVNGVTFSATPSWVTASDLSGYGLGDAISIQLAATGANTFALAAGSTLPTGLTLSAGGLLSGSVTGLENDTSYSFTITATDAENQDSPRTFSITITVQLQVSRSLRFNSADSAHVLRTFGATGNLQTFSVSCWFKRSALGASNPIFVAGTDVADYMFITFTSGDIISVTTGETGTTNLNLINSTAVFRDTAAWYHLVVAFDFANATSTDRIRVFVNGVRQTMTGTYASSSFTGTRHNRAGILHYIGRWPNGSSFFNGYITEFYFIDGLALDPTSFAETNNSTGQYIPKKYTGTYGTNGFYLPFTDNSSVANLGRNYQPLTADPFWDRTVLLLNGTGTNNANNNTFIDSSTNAFAITRNGNVSQGRFSPFTQGGWSNYFDGTGDYLELADNDAWWFGSGDFTVEAWIYHTSGNPGVGGTQQIVGQNFGTESQRSWTFSTNGNSSSVTGLYGEVCVGSTLYSASATGLTISLNTWHHVAFVRTTSTLRLFLNGQQVATGAVSGSANNAAQVLAIGRNGFSGYEYYFYGYISNLRIVKGTSVYTGAFAPPTTALTAITNTSLLTCHANRFLDSSTNNFAITRNGDARVVAFSPFTPTTAYSAVTNGGSAYFDGTGDYLQTTISALPGQFTVEFWFYRLTTGNNFMFNIGDSINNTGAEVYIGTNGTVLNYYSNGNARITATPPNAGTWSYIAVSRDASNVVRLYVDGTQVGGTYTQAATLDTTLRVGAEYYNAAITGTATGYISGFRVSNTARTITVPTQPLVNDANTVCLLNFTNAGIVDATGDNNIETVGDAKISTAQSKWAGSSMAFDGTGDYLSVPYSPNLNMGTGNFTCEFWVYVPLNPSVSYPSIVGPQDTAPYGIGIRYGNTGYANKFTVHLYAVSSWVGDPILASSSTYSLSQWHHVALTRSGTTLTLWVNGVSAASTTSSNQIDFASNNKAVWIGASFDGANSYFNGYIQDLRITRAARYTGNFTPPTAQFAYNQGDINYNQWVPTNFSVTAGAGNDSLLDVPTNWGVDTGLGGEVRGNYATLNPINNSGGTFTNGNLDWTTPATDQRMALSSMTVSGISKWYCEFTMGSKTGLYWSVGIFGNSTAWNPRLHYRSDGARWVDSTQQAGNWSSFTQNDIIGIAFDGPTGTATFYKNGVSQGTMTVTDLTVLQYFGCTSDGSGGTMNYTANFGQRPFAYAAPSGFKSLNTHNLPALAVTKSNTAFDTVLYTGTGSALTVGGYNFSPDIIWYKSRSSGVYYHGVFDTVRGATKFLATNDPGVEVTDSARLSAFTANGFTAGTDVGINTSGANMVAWAWDAGTTTVVNTAGTIQSNVRVNAAAGISIVSYTGTQATATVGHGLGTAPKLILAKSRSATNTNWVVYHSSLGSTSSLLILNLTNATTTITNYWGSAVPTSTVFGVANGVYDNNNGSMIAYCFAEIPGFSAFGTYTGNGSTDGPFVYTGFRPRFILLKSSTVAATNWQINDTARDTYNVANKRLAPSAADAEATNFDFGDILSNGFKIRQTDQTWNSNGQTYIYAAFAESPFKYARAR